MRTEGRKTESSLSSAGSGNLGSSTNGAPRLSEQHVDSAGDQECAKHLHTHNGHGHAHDHGNGTGHGGFGHSHFSHADTAQKLAFSVGLTLIILGAEIAGGLLAHSLALLSDAAHMVTDVAALGLAWYAQKQAGRPATHRRTYGFHRAGIMAALANAVTLIGIAGFIGWEAVERIRHPVAHIHAPIMFGVAAVALVVNLAIARMLGHSHSGNLNVRSALLHVMGDAAASAGVLVGGVIIAFEPGWTIVDPLLSVGIAGIIVVGAWQILMETMNVLMEGTPTGLDLLDLEKSLLAIPEVHQVHHLHIWTLCPGMNALSGHVVVEDQSISECEQLLGRIQTMLRERFNVDHATLQLEHKECDEICTLLPGL